MLVDIFNGDADGIFALHQFRLANPTEDSRLITGIKRDIRLLSQIEEVSNSEISVFDISLDVNRASLEKLLQQGNRITYFDHHFAGEIPASDALTTNIQASPDVCTSMLVNLELQGKFSTWAVCGAFGDNLHPSALQLAKQAGLSEEQTDQLRELGELFNYNGYGESTADLHFHPRDLYLAVANFKDPFDFLDQSPEMRRLADGHREDMAKAEALQPESGTTVNRVYFLPNAPWARRISGVFSNLRAREKTEAAHAIIGKNSDNSLRISVRAPLANKTNADTLCRKFPSGGGRAAAAGINNLPEDMLEAFLQEFHSTYS